MRNRPPFWASFFTVLALILLTCLGIWQFKRLAWKTALIERMTAQAQIDPGTVQWGAADLTPAKEFERGTLHGTYAPRAPVLIGPRTHRGKAGFHVLSPLRLADGEWVWINRGWAPTGFAPQTPVADPSPVRVFGMIRKPERPNPFTPDNRPDQDQWYRMDLEAMTQARKLEGPVAPVVLYTLGNPQETPFPDPSALNFQPPNNHLGYALFWFSMAGVLAAIYLRRFVFTGREKTGPESRRL